MPFTLAHPAAVLPLRYLRFLRTAPLFVGAVVPDVPYYLPFFTNSRPIGRLYTHNLVGAWRIDLPLGLALLACLVLLREPLTVLLPTRARWLCLHALEPFRQRVSEWVLAPLAIILGVWTHLVWDSFTHGDLWGVRHFPVLAETVTIGWYQGEIYHVLQYVSSVVGLAIVAVWYARLRVPADAAAGDEARRAHAGPALLLIAGAALLIGGVEAVRYYMRIDAVYGTLDVLLTRGLAWYVLLYLFAGCIVALEHRVAGARGH